MTLEFIEDVEEVGQTASPEPIGYLHGNPQVIERVLKGDYDVGVAVEKAFRLHRDPRALPGNAVLGGLRFHSLTYSRAFTRVDP